MTDDNRTGIRDRLYARYVSTHCPTLETQARRSGDARRSRVLARLYGRHLPRSRKSRILDLGCGHGDFLAYLRSVGYHDVEGVDRSPEQVSLARTAGLPVRHGDIFEFLKGVESSYHLITALDVLEHLTVAEILDLTERIHRALKPGGVFLFQSPCAEGPFGSRYRYSDLTHVTAFTPRSVGQLLRSAGFEKITVDPVRPVVLGPLSAVRHLVWRLGEWGFRLLLTAETGQRSGMVLTQNLIAVGRKPAPSPFTPHREDV